MTDKDSARQQVAALVEKFDADYKRYTAPSYNETQVRVEFINRFFESLGWDISDSKGRHEVFHEDYVEVEEAGKKRGKRPDYGFRLNNTTRFYVEAKKPSVNLKDDPTPAFQVRRYGWSARLPVSVLTDFEEFIVYDCRIKPDEEDRPTKGRLRYYTYKEYVEKWDEIYDLFSYEAVQANRLETWIQETKQRGTVTVDDAFLSEMEEWREALAKNIAKNNHGLTRRQLNMAVQTTIDRIVFLRICEDRGIEPPDRLQSFGRGKDIYANLVTLFKQADQRYNSGLFHFNAEKGREQPDTITPNLVISDKPLKDIITRLYYPSPYAFSVIPADILGQIYERFLGKVIELTPSGGAKVEEKPEVRKAGGVFYTPTYIVEYIVKNTVGKLVEGKTPDQVAKLRILDPACGSGSFLIGAYQFLLDWHLNYYTADGTAKHLKAKRLREVVSTAPAVDDAPAAVTYALTSAEKKRILLNNLYGVDLDQQAVEVTKLSLLLKVLEGETAVTSQPELFAERVLPDLGDNIKWGNSLIGPEYYSGKQLALFGDEELDQVKTFDWGHKTEGFGNVIAQGGFDVIIGNPPWGAVFLSDQLEYLKVRFRRVINRMVDSYIYFIDKGIQLVKQDNPIGFIIPSTILNQVDASAIRKLLLLQKLSHVINLGQGIFGPKVLNTSTILITGSKNLNDKLIVDDLSRLPIEDRKLHLFDLPTTDWNIWKDMVEADPHLTFFAGNFRSTSVLDRLRSQHISLNEIIDGQIQRGVSPDVVSAHVVTNLQIAENSIEADVLRPSISGSRIKRYHPVDIDQYIIYTDRNLKIDKYPNTKRYLQKFRSLNTCKEVIDKKHPWWSLHRPRDPVIFSSPKMIGLTTSKTIELVYDYDSDLVVTDAMYVFKLQSHIDPFTLMAIMQSKLFLFLYQVANQGEARVIPQIKASKLYSVPYPSYKSDDPIAKSLSGFSKTMLDLHKQLAAAPSPQVAKTIQSVIAKTDRDIDQLVYQLYDLTPEEIALVEGNA